MQHLKLLSLEHFRVDNAHQCRNNNLSFLLANWWPKPTSRAEMMFNRAFLKVTLPINLILNIMPFMAVCHILIDHRHSLHLPNLLPYGTLIYCVTYLIYIIFFIYALFYCTSRAKILISAVTLQTMIVLPLLRQEFRLKQDTSFGKRKYPLVPEFWERPENIVNMYRSLQIFLTEICYVFGLGVLPLQAILGQIVISTAYLLISGGRGTANSRSRLTSVILFGTIPSCVVSWTIMLTFTGWCISRRRIVSHRGRRGGLTGIVRGIESICVNLGKAVSQFISGIRDSWWFHGNQWLSLSKEWFVGRLGLCWC